MALAFLKFLHLQPDDKIAMVEIAPLQAQGVPQVFPLSGTVAVFEAVMAGFRFTFRRFGAG